MLARIPDAIIHGRGAPRAPHISNISVPGTESESMLIALDLRGIACSAGSACQSGSITPSHVLEAIGVSTDVANAAIRISLGALTHRRERRSRGRGVPDAGREGAPSRDGVIVVMRERVLVAMSGGVDSSVAAALLVRQGYDVVGATMKLFCHGEDVPDRPCCSLDSVNDARRICEQLGVPHYVLNLESAFGHDVVQDFVDEYARGRTPIPCVRCNTFTKFRDLVRKADAIDARWIATGHYARVIDGALHRGLDPAKDQSYFLWGIDRARARRACCSRSARRRRRRRAAIAHELGLELIAEKRESQDICFVPDGDHTQIIARDARRGDAGARARTVRAARRHGGRRARTGTRASPSASGAGCRADSRSRCSSSPSSRRRAPW